MTDYAIFPAARAAEAQRWHNDVCGYPAAGRGKHAAKTIDDVTALDIPGAALRYKDPVLHPTDGRVAFVVDDYVRARWQEFVDDPESTPADVAKWQSAIDGAAPLPADWELPKVKNAQGNVVEPARHKHALLKPQAAKALTKKTKPAPGPKPVQGGGKKTP